MLGIITIAIPLLVYIAGALSVTRREFSHPDDYFVAYRRVGITAFSSSSIAYAFQVSTIYPFLFWGTSHLYFVPAVNTIGWGLGIILFYLSFPRYKSFIGSDLTLHGFLGTHYGLRVRQIASYLTITGFFGFALAETYFGSKVLLSIIADKNIFYLLLFIGLMFVYAYITYGGQLSSLRTDQLQLIIAYIGIFGLMLYLMFVLFTAHTALSGILPLSFRCLIVYIPLIIAIRRFKFIRISESGSVSSRIISTTMNVLISVLLISIFIFALYHLGSPGLSISTSKFVTLKGFGISGLLSLAILPLCWQFVDLTNWQRLLCVHSDNTITPDSLYSNIKTGLLIYAIESPFTWIIFLFFGLLTVSAFPHTSFHDLLIDLPKHLISSHDRVENIFGYMFIVSILAIMFSTVDSFIIGVIFTFVYDSYTPTRVLLDTHDTNTLNTTYKHITRVGQIFGLCLITGGMVVFILLDKSVTNGGEMFINLLLAFYSAQLSLFPLVFGSLFLKRYPSPLWANLSMVVSAAIGISIGIYAVIWNQSYAWYPIVVCFAISCTIYSIGLLFDWMNSLQITNDVMSRINNIRNRCTKSTIIFIVAILLNLLMAVYARFIMSHPVIHMWLYLGKLWEITALVLTAIYTPVFWFGSDKGKEIWQEITHTKMKRILKILIITDTFLIGLIIMALFAIMCVDDVKLWWAELAGPVLIFIIFCIIDVIMIYVVPDESPGRYYLKDALFKSDLPTVSAFILLCLYGWVVFPHMEIFFSGAIAFQMLLSIAIWINTEVMDRRQIDVATGR